VEQVVARIPVVGAAQSLGDSLRRDVDVDIEGTAIHVSENLVAGRHLNLQTATIARKGCYEYVYSLKTAERTDRRTDTFIPVTRYKHEYANIIKSNQIKLFYSAPKS